MFVSHLSVWVWVCNCYIQFSYLFPNPDTALSNWKSSRLELSVPLESQHKKFCCFFSKAVQLSPQLQHTLLPLGNNTQYLSKWERINTLRTGEANLRFYITTVQDGLRKSAFLKRACFSCTIHLIMQYIEPVSKWSCWRMFIETWPNSELTFRFRASSIQGQMFRYSPENAFYIFNQQIYFIIWYLLDGASLT